MNLDRQTDRQTGRQTDRQTGRQAGRQTDKDRGLSEEEPVELSNSRFCPPPCPAGRRAVCGESLRALMLGRLGRLSPQ